MRRCCVNYENQQQLLKAIILILIVYKLYNYYKIYMLILLAIKKNRINNSKKNSIIKKDKSKNEEKHSEVKDLSLSKLNTNIKNEEKVDFKKIIAHIPLVVTEKRIDIPIEKEITFNENVIEILKTKSDVYINDTKFIPLRISEINKNKLEGELVLEAKLISTIHYNSLEKTENNACKGYIKTLKTLFPIKIRTLIECYRPPDFDIKNKINISCCIKEATIFIKDFLSKKKSMKENANLNIFNKINRKIVLNLLINVTQILPVNIHNNLLIGKPSTT